MAFPVLRSKFRPPELPPIYIPRPDLLGRLQHHQGSRLVLVRAGPGYGKSLLLAEWARFAEKCLWYSLDPIDRDPAALFQHLITGLEDVLGEFSRRTRGLLQVSRIEPAVLLQSLLDELSEKLAGAGGGKSLLIVLDDYQSVENPQVVDSLITGILSQLPADVRVAVGSRTELPFLAEISADSASVLELGERDLRFDQRMVSDLFPDEQQAGAEVKSLIARMEGWPAGLVLIHTMLRSWKPRDEVMPRVVAAPARQEMFHLLTEAHFARQPEELQRFLLQTSILGTFSPQDSDAIFERTDSRRWLAHLVEQNAFAIQVHLDPDSYRFHPVFAAFLKRKLDLQERPEVIRAWHRQASSYYQLAGLWEAAYHHADHAGEEALLASVILTSFGAMRFAGRLDTVQGWFDRLPQETFEAYPHLLSFQGHLWEERGHHERAVGAFRRAIEIAEARGEQRPLISALSGLGIVHQRTGKLEAAQQAFSQAAALAEGATVRERYIVETGLGLVLLYSGLSRRAFEKFQICLELAASLSRAVQAQAMSNLGAALTSMGEFASALHWIENSLSIRREEQETPGIVVCLVNRGFIFSRTGEGQRALADFEECLDLGAEGLHPSSLANLLSNRGDVYRMLDDLPAAERDYQQSIEHKEILQDVPGLVHTWAQRSLLRLQQGRPDEALAMAGRAVKLSEGGGSGLNERLLAQSALALARMRSGQVAEAVALLEEVIERHRQTTENHLELARCLLHLALARRANGQDAAAVLEEALALVGRWGYGFLLENQLRHHPELLKIAVQQDLQSSALEDRLSHLGDAAVPALAELSETGAPEIRMRAIERLIRIGSDGVWQPLVNASKERDENVRNAARQGLARLGQAAPDPLHVRTLGKFELWRGQNPIADSDWGNLQAQRVFKYLLHRAGNQVHREQLMDLLWPEVDPEASAPRLNQAIFVLRKTLEPYLPARTPSRYLITSAETYRLELPAASWIDSQAFEAALSEAERARSLGDRQAAILHYEQAAELYRGDFLEGERYLDWFLLRREQLREKAFNALSSLGRLQFATGAPERTVEIANRLLAMDPLIETGYALLMEAQLALGGRDAVFRTFQLYQEQVCRLLEVEPSEQILAILDKAREQKD